MDQSTFDAPPMPPTAPPQYVYVQQPTYMQRARTNGMAIASLVCSIVCLFGVGSVLGIIFGIVAKSQIRDAATVGERQEGGGLATAGIIVGVLGIVGLIAFFALVGAAANHVGHQWNSYSDCMSHVSAGSSTFTQDMNTCSQLLNK